MDRINSRVSIPIWLVALSTLLLLSALAVAGVTASSEFSRVASASPTLYDEQAVVDLFQRTSPAVVEIEVTQSNASHSMYALPTGGQGSGFLVDTGGHILTNYHVVRGAEDIKVILSDGRTLEAQVAGTSPVDDIALIKVDAGEIEGISPLPLGDSSVVKHGQMAVVMGSPYGLDNSITVGVVSGIDRTRIGILNRPITGMIQTDASMNPGNSGGPVLNSLGEVIGISTSIETSINGATGIGFAVPINTAKNLLVRLKENATVKRPWLGISGMAVTSAMHLSAPKGIYITEVMPNSPAHVAGLRGGSIGIDGNPPGDIIIAVDGQEVDSVGQLVVYFNTLQPGDEVTLTVVRGDETLDLSVVLGEWPDSFETSPG